MTQDGLSFFRKTAFIYLAALFLAVSASSVAVRAASNATDAGCADHRVLPSDVARSGASTSGPQFQDAFSLIFPDPSTVRLSDVSALSSPPLEVDPTAIVTDDKGVYYYSPGRAPTLSLGGNISSLTPSEDRFFSNDSYLNLGSFLRSAFVPEVTNEKTFWNNLRQYHRAPAASLPSDLSTYISYYDPSVIGAFKLEDTTVAFSTASYVYLGNGTLYHSLHVVIFDGKPHRSEAEIEELVGRVLVLPSQPYTRQVYAAQRPAGAGDIVYFNGLAFVKNAAPSPFATMMGDYYSVNPYTFVASYRFDPGDKTVKPDPRVLATSAVDPRRATFRFFTTNDPIADSRGRLLTRAGATAVFSRITVAASTLPAQ
jgi:hypothetical protein